MATQSGHVQGIREFGHGQGDVLAFLQTVSGVKSFALPSARV